MTLEERVKYLERANRSLYWCNCMKCGLEYRGPNADKLMAVDEDDDGIAYMLCAKCKPFPNGFTFEEYDADIRQFAPETLVKE